MPEHVLTEVSAVVAAERESALIAGFAALLDQPLPDGLLRTELLRGSDAEDGRTWRIQTLWRDRQALDAMRASAEPPAAPALFRSVGAEPSLTVLTVAKGRRFGE
ncbi:antibiotic biosynthesis monooxygenase [Microbacterium sp. ASV81]|uniref:Antibiotic biosynthesis monooxygenase n=1 Tax=Microbacterium capsulatum TaxID=3041921 RepID=A0ABU0XDL3_9MICO|nr:antibiotic biosynthesis monooxygenase [Microbacterium sp. ASV81]MDQ4213156.1 antibiotic biosynthesis monooxygenase [Microbacterium sp. ASV81]